jgi:hypothetical protein
MDKKAMSGGMIVLIIALLAIGAYMFIPSVKDSVSGIFNPTPTTPVVTTKCPSSGLTEVTLNSQKALAATATNAITDYYVFEKDGTYVTTGNSGTDGQSVFNVACATNKKYDILVINETAANGYYGEVIEADASGPTFSKSLKMYLTGDINLVSVGSSTNPANTGNISSGLGKTCGFVITFSENVTASAYNKPLIMCETNISSVTDITMSGVTAADSKKPNRISTTANSQYHTYELNTLLKSTDAAQKVTGTITFSASTTPSTTDSMTCKIADQAMWKKAAYQTLTYIDGFITGAENTETNADVGALDSNPAYLYFGDSSGYC